MASPQTENGYTRIANEILERLVNTPLLGSEFQVLLCIVRKTYGYQKKVDIISLSQFQKATGVSRPTVVKTLKNLVTRRMIVKVYLPEDKIAFSFNKDYDSWVVKEHLLVKDKWVTSKGVFTKSSKGALTHKRKKETNTKEREAETSSAIPQIIKLFEGINPNYEEWYSNKTQRKAVSDLLERIGFEKLERLVKALPSITSQKTAPRITTPYELKRDWAKLGIFISQQKNSKKEILI